MAFTSYTTLWNPRPEQIVSPDAFKEFEDKGWIAQSKKNGTGSQVGVAPNKQLTWRTRHNVPHKQWVASAGSRVAFETLPGNGWYVFSLELLNSKVAKADGGVRDVNYIHDILVHDGEFLFDVSYDARCDLLRSLFLKGGEEETPDHIAIDAHTWLAKNHTGPFKPFMDSLTTAEDEGIVLKNPRAPLAFCTKVGANSNWQRKSRHATLNYAT